MENNSKANEPVVNQNPVAIILELLHGRHHGEQNEILISVAREITEMRVRELNEKEKELAFLKESTEILAKRNGL